MKPLEPILLSLEASLKRKVIVHATGTPGPWLNLRQRMDSTTTLSLHALEFAIQCVEQSIKAPQCNAIKSIAAFSDVDHIQRLLDFNT